MVYYYGIGAWFSYKLLLVFDYVEVWGQEEVTREAWRDGARNHQVKISKAIRGLGEVNGFEGLDEGGMLTHSRSRNRRIADTDWRGIAARVSVGGGAVEVDPHLTSRTCSRCG
jgi:transposase